MKIKKITAAFTILLALVLLITACSAGSSVETTAATNASTTAAATTTASTAKATTKATTAAATPASTIGTTAPTTAATTAAAVEGLDYVELDWYTVLGPPEMPDTAMVWEHLNEYLKEKINVNVNYHINTAADMITKVSTMITAGQTFDICYTGQGVPYLENAERNAFVPLDDLMPKYAPMTLAQVPEYAWEAMRVNGIIYAIPAYKDLAQWLSLVYNKTMSDDLGIDVESHVWKNYSDLIPLLYDVNTARDAKYPNDVKMPIVNATISFSYMYLYDIINTFMIDNIPGIDDFPEYDSGATIFNMYETKEYRSYAHLMKQLVDDYITPYDSDNYDPDSARLKAGEFFARINAGYISVQPDLYSNEWDCALSNSSTPYTWTAKITGNGQAISTTSKNQERSLMFLELVNNDNFVATTLRFGIEGTHYFKLDDGRVTFNNTPNNSDPKNRGYFYWYGAQIGSIFVMSIPDYEPVDFFEIMDARNRMALASSNMGFTLNRAPVETELAVINSIITEYSPTFTNGMYEGDLDALLDEFIAALKEAGSEKVMAEAQNQLNTWRAAKGLTVAG